MLSYTSSLHVARCRRVRGKTFQNELASRATYRIINGWPDSTKSAPEWRTPPLTPAKRFSEEIVESNWRIMFIHIIGFK